MTRYEQLRACLWILENYAADLGPELTEILLMRAKSCLADIVRDTNAALAHR